MEHAIAVDSFLLEIDESHQIVIIKGTGNVDYEKTLEIIDEVMETLNDHPDYTVLAQMESVSYHPTFNEIMSIKNKITGLKSRLKNKIAVVTTGRLTIIADMICAFSNLSSIKMKSFQSEDDALNWLLA